jgi:hypothetical protein
MAENERDGCREGFGDDEAGLGEFQTMRRGCGFVLHRKCLPGRIPIQK